MGYDVVEAQTFWDCVLSLRRNDDYRAELMDALLELRVRPFHNPKLQTHDVGKALNGKPVFSSDVGGRRRDRRLIWQVFNRTIVVLLYGTHAVQQRAKRMRIGFDDGDRVVTIYERATDTDPEHTYQEQRVGTGRLFMAWTDDELRSFGFAEPTVEALRNLDHDDELLALEASLLAEEFERAFNLVAFGHPSGAEAAEQQARVEGGGTEAHEPKPTDEDHQIERQLGDERGGTWFTRSEPEFLREVLTRPIEDWMIFLHPDQHAIVRRHFDGPARVRGSAGTGKTVVGLHRAAWLAERIREADHPDGYAGKILFTTYIRSLPPVFESLYLRLPGTRRGDVEFVHLDKLAAQVCIGADDRQITAPREIDAAFATACKRIVTVGSPLATAGFSRQYLRDEINAVVKGRGITSLDAYLEVARTGRRAPMGRPQRTQLSELMTEWDAEMAKRGTVDFADVVLRARDHARRLDHPRYAAAVVDEAQDLSLVGLQLIRALVNAPETTDRPNGLLLLGDGAQRIYAGGFTLRQAGVEVRGRTTVLRVNYRNTNEIIGTAMAVAGAGQVEDLAEEFRRGDAPAETERHGRRPTLVEAADFEDQLDEVARRVVGLVDEGGAGIGDIGVLVPTNRMAQQVVARLRGERLAVQELEKYDGQPNQRVKVGTYHRAKGLEFKAVFLPGLSRGVFPRAPRDTDSAEEAAEATDLALSQLFVAMTRARDVLVVLYDGEVADALSGRLDQFERTTT